MICLNRHLLFCGMFGIILPIFASCTGYSNTIEFSTNELVFSAEESTHVIRCTSPSGYSNCLLGNDNSPEINGSYYDIYGNPVKTRTDIFGCEWCKIRMYDKNKDGYTFRRAIVTVSENDTGQKRTCIIIFTLGDDSGQITIIQNKD